MSENSKQTDVNVMRRESDRDLRNKLSAFMIEQSEIVTELKLNNQRLENVCQTIETHERLFRGNGKDGLMTVVSKLSDSNIALWKELYDPQTGILVKVNRLDDRRKEWEATSQKVQNLEIKAGVLTVIAGFIGAWLHKIF